MPSPTSTRASSGSRAASPQTPTGLSTALPGGAGGGDQVQHGGLPRVEQLGELAGHPVGGHRVLGEVVGADAGEVDDRPSCAGPAARRPGTSTIIPATGSPCARTLSVNALASCTVDTIGAITQTLAPVALAAWAIASSWSSSSCGKTPVHPVAADAERRVLLLLAGREGQRLVGAGVERADDHLAVAERLEHLRVGLGLVRDGRRGRRSPGTAPRCGTARRPRRPPWRPARRPRPRRCWPAAGRRGRPWSCPGRRSRSSARPWPSPGR